MIHVLLSSFAVVKGQLTTSQDEIMAFELDCECGNCDGNFILHDQSILMCNVVSDLIANAPLPDIVLSHTSRQNNQIRNLRQKQEEDINSNHTCVKHTDKCANDCSSSNAKTNFKYSSKDKKQRRHSKLDKCFRKQRLSVSNRAHDEPDFLCEDIALRQSVSSLSMPIPSKSCNDATTCASDLKNYDDEREMIQSLLEEYESRQEEMCQCCSLQNEVKCGSLLRDVADNFEKSYAKKNVPSKGSMLKVSLNESSVSKIVFGATVSLAIASYFTIRNL